MCIRDSAKIAQMRKASREDRGQLWRDFVHETDPNTGTPENELLANYFSRLAYANTRFRDEGIAGWRTDRGEVFIALGEPDEIYDQSLQTGPVRYMRWMYNEARVTLYFEDVSGFGRFRLAPQSRGDFESAKARMKRR